jgi:hypothetical protein
MLGQRRLEVIQRLLNPETRKLMKQMQKSLFVPQTEYMYAALVEHDEERMAMFEAQFEKVAKKYPIQSDVERAREDIAKIRELMRSEEAPTGKITTRSRRLRSMGYMLMSAVVLTRKPSRAICSRRSSPPVPSVLLIR